jgi:hypothetical protein
MPLDILNHLEINWKIQVALKNSDDSVFCTGTLISDSKVLLAAQCLER